MNADTSTQEQSANDDKSVFTPQGKSQVADQVNNYGTDVSSNSATIESQCKGCDTGKCGDTSHNKNKSS